MSVTYRGGLNFSYVTQGSTAWWYNAKLLLEALSTHAHTMYGDGVKLASAAISADALTSSHICLSAGTALRGSDSTGQYLPLLQNAGTGVVFNGPRGDRTAPEMLNVTPTATASATYPRHQVSSVSGTPVLTVANGSVTGQYKWVHSTATNPTLTYYDATIGNIAQSLPRFPSSTWGTWLPENVNSNRPSCEFTYCTVAGVAAWRPTAFIKAKLPISSTTITSDGSLDIATYASRAERGYAYLAICNKASALAVTLAPHVLLGTKLYVVNIGVGTATITPSVSTSANTAALTTNGHCMYVWGTSSTGTDEWTVIAGQNCTIS